MKLSTIIAAVAIFLCMSIAADAQLAYYWRVDYYLNKKIPYELFIGKEQPYSSEYILGIINDTFVMGSQQYFPDFKPVYLSVYWSDRGSLVVTSVVQDESQLDQIKANTSGAEGLDFIVQGSNGIFEGHELGIKFDSVKSSFGTLDAACANGVQDRQETDVDCGGDCAPCTPGLKCEKASDCSFNGKSQCLDGRCQLFNNAFSTSASIVGVFALGLLAIIF